MNRIGFFLSGLLSFLGVCTIILTKIINLVLPKLGYMAFQAAAAGSYSAKNYLIDFSIVNLIAYSLIFIGLFLASFFYRAGE